VRTGLKAALTAASVVLPNLLIMCAMGWTSLPEVSVAVAWATFSSWLVVLIPARHRRDEFSTKGVAVTLAGWVILACWCWPPSGRAGLSLRCSSSCRVEFPARRIARARTCSGNDRTIVVSGAACTTTCWRLTMTYQSTWAIACRLAAGRRIAGTPRWKSTRRQKPRWRVATTGKPTPRRRWRAKCLGVALLSVKSL
jgi:hypothetical protein